MYCMKCGKELVENAKYCYHCGCEVGSIGSNDNEIKSPNVPISKANTDTPTKKKKKKKKDPTGAICLALILIIALGIGGYCLYKSNIPIGSHHVEEIFKSDEELIIGSWRLDTTGYGEGLDYIENIDGVIYYVTFYSDGTCVVGQSVNAESGTWSITDGTLIIKGDISGMFWSYHGFASEYSLDGDTLTVYDEDETYVYYREY